MSDRSPEDEIMSEARKFAASMSMTLRRYAQAANWMERRKIRKEIKQAWRSELREQEAERANQLLLTQRAVDRFRAHSLKVAERAADPSVDHERRYRDDQHLARHRNDMAERVLRNPRLTVVEQGIALDGLDAASKFPTHNHGRLFDKASRVKGLQALHYRATVARAQESAGVPRPGQEMDPIRYTAWMASKPQGAEWRMWTPARRFATEAGAMGWLHRQVADTHWGNDTQVHVEAWDLDDTSGPMYSDEGRPDRLVGYLAAEASAARERAERPDTVDRSADDPWRRGGREQQHGADAPDEETGRYRATVGMTDRDGVTASRSRSFDTEQDATAWMRSNPGMLLTFGVAAHARLEDTHNDRVPLYSHSGEHGAVWASLAAREKALASQHEQGVAPERAAERTGADRTPDPAVSATTPSHQTDIEREFAALKDRHRLSIQHTNALVERNSELVKQLTAVTAERDQLRDTAAELTDQAATRNGAQHGQDWAEQFIAAVDADEREQQAGRDTGLTVLRAEQARPRIHDQLSDQARAVVHKAEQRQAAQERQWAEDEESNHDIKAFHDAQADRPGTVRIPGSNHAHVPEPAAPANAFAGLGGNAFAATAREGMER
ncbi:hypothetical protein [Nocardia brasiliensis]|uniref:hypothetical protein n=1 Tax=Nocardia brasiliensis TaxID=37326 RepID=UPI00245785DB|nr:hypothetical protein [Nocardia brasiliensis]